MTVFLKNLGFTTHHSIMVFSQDGHSFSHQDPEAELPPAQIQVEHLLEKEVAIIRFERALLADFTARAEPSFLKAFYGRSTKPRKPVRVMV